MVSLCAIFLQAEMRRTSLEKKMQKKKKKKNLMKVQTKIMQSKDQLHYKNAIAT